MTPESVRDKSKIALMKVIEDGSIVNFEKPCIKKCGSIIYINMSIALMPDKNRVLVTAKDITLMKKFEQNSKLASMGEMLENIAHQWKQPLSGITALSSAILVRLDLNIPISTNDLIENMNNILEYSNYMSQTITDFRNFLNEKKEKEIFNIANVIEQSLNIVKGDLRKSDISTITNLDDSIVFFGYQNELMQVIINILNNAKDAMVENNIIDKNIIIDLFTANNKIIITIEDNGKGIPDNIISKIFDSHFTTKNDNGTGIGLYMSKQIINNSFNGELSVENVKDGAKFIIIFSGDNMTI
jgi:signal transduction histidine kinase